MKKILVACITACVLALIGYGGYYYVSHMPPDVLPAAENSEPVKKKTAMTAITPPENDADVLDSIDYAYSLNKNSVGWLRIPDTDINNPVMQGDDNDYYLRRDENGEHDVYGCYFLDYECTLGTREEFSPNTVIYGHSELTDDKDGKRFAQLYRFLDDDFAQKNKTIYLNTLQEKFEFEVISVFYTDLSFRYHLVNITDDEALAIEEKAISLSERDYGVSPEKGDKLLTLSTCTAKFEDAENHRFVVMARLLPKEEHITE